MAITHPVQAAAHALIYVKRIKFLYIIKFIFILLNYSIYLLVHPTDPITHFTELKRLANGDPAALRYFYMRYAGKITAFAQKLLGNREEAEDITHSLFLALWEDRKEVTRITSLDAYLFRMARNAVMNRLRCRSRDLDYRRNQGLSDQTPDSEAEADKAAMDTRLMDAISRLPEPQKSIIMMSRFKGMSYNEISERLNISAHTVHYHISRALRTLRHTLGLLIL